MLKYTDLINNQICMPSLGQQKTESELPPPKVIHLPAAKLKAALRNPVTGSRYFEHLSLSNTVSNTETGKNNVITNRVDVQQDMKQMVRGLEHTYGRIKDIHPAGRASWSQNWTVLFENGMTRTWMLQVEFDSNKAGKKEKTAKVVIVQNGAMIFPQNHELLIHCPSQEITAASVILTMEKMMVDILRQQIGQEIHEKMKQEGIA
jgi:hypothetical protein